MIGKLIKWTFYIVVILLIFAILPKSILDKIKTFLNWDVFLKTLKIGFQNFLNFLKEIGIDFGQINEKIKNFSGLDLLGLWLKIKNFLADLLLKLANTLK